VPSGKKYVESTLFEFDFYPDGAQPIAGLVAANGLLYGTALFGGKYNSCPDGPGCGTVFSISPSGSSKSQASLGN
jgi:uncharacterized repeat protein (TIGR03803 family)